jgi:hypothetical protein
MQDQEYIKNIWRMRVMVIIAIASFVIFFFGGCRMVDIGKGSIELKDQSSELLEENSTTKSTNFDTSITESENQFTGWKPIDASKEMEIRNIEGGTRSKNAEKTYRKTNKTKKNNKKIIEDKSEAVKKTTDTESSDKQTWFKKNILSIPPFNLVIVALFIFLSLYLLKTRKTANFTKNTLSEILNKLNS